MAVQNLTYTLELPLHSLSPMFSSSSLSCSTACHNSCSVAFSVLAPSLHACHRDFTQACRLAQEQQANTGMIPVAAPMHLDICSGHSGAGADGSAPASLHLDVVLNPLSIAAQHVAPILEWLRTSFHTSIKV